MSAAQVLDRLMPWIMGVVDWLRLAWTGADGVEKGAQLTAAMLIAATSIKLAYASGVAVVAPLAAWLLALAVVLWVLGRAVVRREVERAADVVREVCEQR